MRKIIASILCLLAVTAICAQTPLEHINFDDNWQFSFGNASDPAKDFGCGTEYFNYLTKAASIHNEVTYVMKFDASGWKTVDLPHDWVVDLGFAKEASHSHGYKQVGYKYPETSVGWYRKVFTIPENDYGKHIWLQFDGIFRNSQVWVNGFYLGHEPSGYATQTYDISEYLNYGGGNLICVRADATLEEGWFYEGAGIYRHVWLNKAAKVHVAPFGTIVYSEFDTDEEGRPILDKVRLNIETTIANKGVKEAGVTAISHRLFDADNSFAAGVNMERDIKLAAKNSAADHFVLELDNPHLWSCDDPYMYTVLTEIICDDGSYDRYETKIGIRHIAFDKDKGFMLNGERVQLKGVNMHQDHAGVGSGIPDGLQEWRLMQLKKFGCNAYRSSHNPMDPSLLDICDRLGILVIEENRLTGINDEHIELLERMIRRDRNHPSIILWSVGNEEWGLEWNDFGRRIAESMREYCHRFDPTRLMTVASSSGPNILVPADVAGYNYIVQNPVDQHRKDYPERRALGSEETTGCGTRGLYFDDHANGRMIALNRQPDVERDSCLNRIERGWKFYAERPWLAGLFYWTGFDYRGEPNPMEFPATGSEFGILDYCGFPKDEAYYLKAWWTEEPVLHILPHWNLAGHEGETVSVWAYSNCDEVELIVNGKKLGRKKMPLNGHLEWDAVYKPGYVKAIGYKGGRKVMEKRLNTTGEAVATEITCERIGDIVIANISLHDAEGRFVPTACNSLTFKTGEGCRILGWGNGDPAFQHVERPADSAARTMDIQAFNGHAQVILKVNGDVPAEITAEF